MMSDTDKLRAMLNGWAWWFWALMIGGALGASHARSVQHEDLVAIRAELHEIAHPDNRTCEGAP